MISSWILVSLHFWIRVIHQLQYWCRTCRLLVGNDETVFSGIETPYCKLIVFVKYSYSVIYAVNCRYWSAHDVCAKQCLSFHSKMQVTCYLLQGSIAGIAYCSDRRTSLLPPYELIISPWIIWHDPDNGTLFWGWQCVKPIVLLPYLGSNKNKAYLWKEILSLCCSECVYIIVMWAINKAITHNNG